MWMMPLHLHINQKSDYDDDDDVCMCERTTKKAQALKYEQDHRYTGIYMYYVSLIYLTFTASLYDGKNMPVSIWEW